MTPPEKYAAVYALIYGLEKLATSLKPQVGAYRRLMRVKGAFETRFGDLSFRLGQPKITYDQPKLLAWAQQFMRHQVVQEHTVVVPAAPHPSIYKVLEKRLQIDGDRVIDTETGEIVDFASVTPAGPDTVVMGLSAEAKELVPEFVAAEVERIVAGLPAGEIE